MDLPITAYPARRDRQQSACINCGEHIYRTDPEKDYSWAHISTGQNQCPEYAQPRQPR